MIRFLIAITTTCTVLLPTLASAQMVGQLKKTTRERDLETLLEAIDTLDDGNLNLASGRGLLPSGSETYVVLVRIASDERVRKIFALLKAMPPEEAASIVAKSYRKSLAQLKESSLRGRVIPGARYGTQAKLWLSYQFNSLENFNRHFSEWFDWYIESLACKKYLEFESDVPGPTRKLGFGRIAVPELMMYLSIVLSEQAKAGEFTDESELSKMLVDAGMNLSPMMSYWQLNVMPYDAELNDKNVEPLLEIPVFSSWGGLDGLNFEERANLISDARSLMKARVIEFEKR